MVIVSGFIEVNDREVIPEIITALRNRDIEVHEVKDERIVFVMERELSYASDIESRIRKELDSLKEIDGVNNVYLAYFCIDEEE